ncbi:MAG: carbohydrate porin [Planctomycetales bacterium]
MLTIALIAVATNVRAQTGQSGADFDPVGLLTRVRETREQFVGGQYDYRFSMLSEDAWLGYIEWNLDLGDQTGLSYLAYYALADQIGTQGRPRNNTANGNTNVIIGWTPPGQAVGNQGGFIFHYMNVGQVGGVTGPEFSQSLGLTSFTNDSPGNADLFRAFAWHQQLLDGSVEMRIGQFEPTALFNINSYASDDTRSFLSAPLSAEPSRTTPGAGLGVIVIGQLLEDVFVGGALADANGKGEFLDFHSFGRGDYMTNAYIAWKPTYCGLSGSYQFAMYFVEATDAATYSRGLGVNIEQSLSENWAVFFKYNQSDKRQPLVRKSAAGGMMWTTPLGWTNDWMGMGFGWSEPTDQTLRDEYVLESFWRMQMTPNTQFTPGVQLWLDPSMTPGVDTQAAFTLRLLTEF